MPGGWFDTIRNRSSESESEEDKKKREQQDLEMTNTLKKVDKIDGLESSINELKSKAGVLDRMDSFLKEQEEAKRRREAEERARKAGEKKETEDKELEELALTDPIKAAEIIAARKTDPIIAATIDLQSKTLRREIFDSPDYEYYQGDFKVKVDKLIDDLQLQHRANPVAIANCYKVVLADHMKDIRDGKLKSRFASVSSSSSSTTSSKDKDEIVLTDEEKRAARVFGIKDEDYAAMKKDMNYV